jgi:hypothetical protein
VVSILNNIWPNIFFKNLSQCNYFISHKTTQKQPGRLISKNSQLLFSGEREGRREAERGGERRGEGERLFPFFFFCQKYFSKQSLDGAQ